MYGLYIEGEGMYAAAAAAAAATAAALLFDVGGAEVGLPAEPFPFTWGGGGYI